MIEVWLQSKPTLRQVIYQIRSSEDQHIEALSRAHYKQTLTARLDPFVTRATCLANRDAFSLLSRCLGLSHLHSYQGLLYSRRLRYLVNRGGGRNSRTLLHQHALHPVSAITVVDVELR